MFGFFVLDVYKELERKETVVDEIRGHNAAVKIVEDAIVQYKEKFGAASTENDDLAQRGERKEERGKRREERYLLRPMSC